MEIYDDDSLRVLVTAIDAANSLPLNITGATLEAIAKRRGEPSIPGAITVLDEVAGEFEVYWAPESFTVATYDVQIRVSIGPDVQTVYDEELKVKRSY